MQNAIEALLPKDEKQVRSVFVGNIPYDTTDDELKEIFGKIGPVLSFRIVHDRETQKPKGYGFCEYRDIETAHSAIRNLNGLEFRNRTLRVDSAVNDKNETNIINPVKSVDTFAHAHTVQNESTSETIVRVISSLNPEQIVELLRQMQCCIKNDPEESREMLAKNPQLCFALLHACLVMKLVDEKDLDALIVKNEQNLNAHVQNYQTFNNVGNSVSNYGEMYAQTRNIDSAQTAEKIPQNFNPQFNKGNLGNMLNPNIPPNINLPPNLKIQQNVGVPQNLGNVQNLNIPPNLVQNVSNQQHFSFDQNFYAGKPNIVDYAGKSTLPVPGNVPVNLSGNVSSSISITSPTSLGPAGSSIPVLAPGTPSHSKVTPHPTSHGAPHSSSHQQPISGQLSSGISGQIPGQMASQIGVQHQGQIQIGGQSGFPPGIPPGGLQSSGLSSGVQSVSASGVQTGLSPSAHLRSQGLLHSGTHLPSHQGSHGISHQTPHQQPHGGPHSGASLQGSHPSARSQDPTQATGNYRQAYQDFRKQKSREYSDFYEDYPRDFESGGAPPATPRSLQFEDYQTDRNSSREDMDFDQYRGQHQEQTYNRFQQEGRGGNRRDARPQYQNEQRYYSSREQRGGKMVQKSDNRGQHTRNQSYHDEYSNERWDRDFQQSSHQGSGEQSRGRQSRY